MQLRHAFEETRLREETQMQKDLTMVGKRLMSEKEMCVNLRKKRLMSVHFVKAGAGESLEMKKRKRNKKHDSIPSSHELKEGRVRRE